MSLASAILIEPYEDPSGEIGFTVCYNEGTVEFLSPDDWMGSKVEEGDRKHLEVLANQSKLWKIPKKPDLEKFRSVWSGYENRIKTEGDFLEARNEYICEVMRGLSLRITRYLNRFCYFEDDRVYDLISAQVILSYFRNWFHISPILTFDGVSGSGKSTTLRAIRLIAYRAFMPASYSAASLIDLVNEFDVTLLLDESLRNLSSDNRGTDLKAFLINMYDRETAKSIRKDMKLNRSVVSDHFTTVFITTLGGEIPTDLRDRSMIVNMSLPDKSIILDELDYLDEMNLDLEIHPDSIRSDLNALRILTISDFYDGKEKAGIVFDQFRETTRRHMKHEEDGRFLYGEVHNMPHTPRIQNRDYGLAKIYYSIGQTMGTEKEQLELIIKNSDEIVIQRTNTTESVLMKAFAEIITERVKELRPSIMNETIANKDLILAAGKISMPDIHAKYWDLRREEGWDMKELDSPRGLTMTFKKLRIPYKEGGGRTNYIDGKHPDFILNFKKAAAVYLDAETQKLFKWI